MGAHRPVEAPADPHLEPGLRPLLDREDARPREPDDHVRRLAALPAVFESAGRAHRAEGVDPIPRRARLHRPAHHRRRHRDPQGLVLQLLSRPRRPHRDRSCHPRQERVHRRGHGDRHRHGDGQRHPARQFLLAAHRAVRTGRRTLARVSRTAHRGELPDDRAAGPGRRAAKSRHHGPAAAEPSARAPASDDRRRRARAHRHPAAGHGAGRKRAGPDGLEVLRLRPGRVLHRLLRPGARGVPRRDHRPAPARPLHQAGQGLSAARLPPLGAPGDHAAHQPALLHVPVR